VNELKQFNRVDSHVFNEQLHASFKDKRNRTINLRYRNRLMDMTAKIQKSDRLPKLSVATFPTE
jgi:DNA gyrase inhibitor GyrI